MGAGATPGEFLVGGEVQQVDVYRKFRQYTNTKADKR